MEDSAGLASLQPCWPGGCQIDAIPVCKGFVTMVRAGTGTYIMIPVLVFAAYDSGLLDEDVSAAYRHVPVVVPVPVLVRIYKASGLKFEPDALKNSENIRIPNYRK